MNYSLALYYKEAASYASEIPSIKRMLETISVRWRIPVEVIEAGGLSEDDVERLKMELRSIQPQIRGRIVTSKRRVLPLSRSKNLNLDNTPILGVRREGRCIDVYPNLRGTHYTSITSLLRLFLKLGPDNYLQLRGLLEEPMVKMISENPSLLGDGVELLGSEVDVGSGVADIVLKAGDGRIIVVEAETHADDFAVGQVSRLAAGYALKHNLDPEDIRKVIVYQSADTNLKVAALSAGIELYRFELRREA